MKNLLYTLVFAFLAVSVLAIYFYTKYQNADKVHTLGNSQIAQEQKNKPQKKWKTQGRKYDPSAGTRYKDDEIDIEEESRSVNMSGTLPYGIPIDANLAVYLISELRRELNSGTRDFTWIKDLLEKSGGITFDKNIVLKIISQPHCEGVRLYPALKNHEGADFLSLVIVGVDSVGTDLHYGDPKQDRVSLGAYDTKSLSGEYGHPPGEGFKSNENKFVLYKYAEKRAPSASK